MKQLILASAAALILSGCGSLESASLMIFGADVALTLERNKPYVWNDGWQLDIIVRNNPQCQRRYKLKDAADGSFKMEVYAAADRGVFILRQNKRWYVTDLRTCELQQFKEAPPEPGTLVGAFQNSKGALAYVPAKTGGDESPDAGKAGG